MVWVSEKGMYSPVRRQEDLMSILETLCRRDDDGSVASGDALLADFVEAHARLLNRTDFLLFMKDVYSRIETILSKCATGLLGDHVLCASAPIAPRLDGIQCCFVLSARKVLPGEPT